MDTRYRYRKIKPEDIVKMRELRAEGLIYKKIGEMFGISMSVVQYHLIPKYRTKSLERAKLSNRNRPKTPKDKKYIVSYIKERYNNDEEFRTRFIGLVKKSHKKRSTFWVENGLCSQCGREKIKKKFSTCEKCRAKKTKQKNDKEKEMGL